MTTIRRRAPASAAADLRMLATGESHARALRELQGRRSPLITAPLEAAQEHFEAEVLGALIACFGRHRPEQYGGPFGIARASGGAEIELAVNRNALTHFARAVLPAPDGDSARRGVTGVVWEQRARQVVLTRAHVPGRIILATTFPRDWARALAEAKQHPSAAENPAPEHVEIDAPLASHLSAVLRRIALLTSIANLPTHHGEIDYRIVAGPDGPRLADLLSWDEVTSAPWLAVHAPSELWPRTAATAGRTATESVFALAARDHRPIEGPVESVLCHLAGIRDTAAGRAAANRAITIAQKNLAKASGADAVSPTGWVANRRRYEDSIMLTPGPVDPPGATAMLAPGLDLAALAADQLRPGALARLDEDERRAALEKNGRQVALTLLDWTLAAATAPQTLTHTWAPASPVPGYDDDRQAELITAAQPVPGGVALQLRVLRYPDGACRFEVQPAATDVPAWSAHASPPLKFGRAPSVPAAMLMAEDAAAEALAALPHLRMRDKRLMRPVPVAPDALFTIADLIHALDAPDDVVDLYTVFSRLRLIADFEVKGAPGPMYGTAADGHWTVADGEHFPDVLTLSAMVGDDSALPATYPGEAANTCAVATAEYRRHLARHRMALDPLAECYLAAADEAVPGMAPFSVRHEAGIAALREADIEALLALDPRESPVDLDWALPRLPVEIQRIEGFFEGWYRRREG